MKRLTRQRGVGRLRAMTNIDITAVRPEEEYRSFLAQGKFMIQRSRASGRHVFYPRVAEPGSGEADLEWVEACGKGTVYATTTVRQRPPAADYNVALIDLDEGVRMMSRVEDLKPGEVRIGMRVQGRVRVDLDPPVVVFAATLEPREGAAHA
jgi:uncharacterized protein